MTQAIPVSEADVKLAVEQWLQYQANQGNLYFERLNAGDYIEARGESRRRIKGAKKGTSDFFVLQAANVQPSYFGAKKGQPYPICRVTFIEIKRPVGGRQSDDQRAFQEKVTMFHSRYVIVRSVDELSEVLR